MLKLTLTFSKIGLNTGNSSAAESPFGGIKESGIGKESGKDVAISEYMVSRYLMLRLPALTVYTDLQDGYFDTGWPLLINRRASAKPSIV